MASQNDSFVDGKFAHVVDLKDGYLISDCRGVRNRRLLELIVLIFHPVKPTRITITKGNTIFKALDGGCLIDSRLVFRDLA